MSLTLTKGQKLDLVKDNPGLDKIVLGLGWKPNKGNGKKFDLDAFATLQDENKKGLTFHTSEGDENRAIIYYGQLKSPDGSVHHTGDNLDGEGEGDDEQIQVKLGSLESNVRRISFGANIYEAASRGQNFGMVQDAYIRLFNETTDEEILRYDLSEGASSATGVILGSLYIPTGGTEWKFEANEQTFNGSLFDLFDSLGN